MNAVRMRERLLALKKEVTELLEEAEREVDGTPAPPPRVMKIKQYAEHRGCGVRTVYTWIKLGLPIEQRGKITRVLVAEADRWDAEAAVRRKAEIAASGGDGR